MSPAKLLITFALVGALAFAGGCSEDGDAPTNQGDGGGGTNAIPTDHTEASAFFDAYERTWEESDLAALSALMDPDFVFKPIADEEYPWIPEGGWTRGIELSIAGNMFDPMFVSEDTGENVDTIEMALSLLAQDNNSVGGQPGLLVVADADITVLWAQGDGATSDARFELQFVFDDNDFLRLLRMDELDPILRSSPSIEANTWGSVKSLYR